MSGRLVGMVFEFYPGGGNELLLAVKLADNADDSGRHIFPAVATLAERTRQSERSVQYQLRRMQATGWLVKVRAARGGGRGGGEGRPAEYRINPVWIAAHDPRVPDSERPKWVPADAPPPQSPREMGAKIAPISDGKRVQPSAEMGAIAVAEMGAIAVAPEPSLTSENNTPLPPTGGERAETSTKPGRPAGWPYPFDPPGFATIVEAYPRRAKLHLARDEYARLQPPAEVQADILRAIAAWRRSDEWQRDEGRWVPRLHEFLRDRRWLDDRVRAAPPPVGAMAAPPMAPLPAKAPVPDAVRALSARLRGQMRGEVRVGA